MAEKLPYLAILLPVLLVSMMLHEVAHGFVAYKLGDPTAKMRGRLSLNPIQHLDPLGTAMFVITYLSSSFMFGWAKPVPVRPQYFKNRQLGMAFVGMAGPITNFILAVIFILIIRWTHPAVGGVASEVLAIAFQVNVILGVFNLVPIPPLDGSRVVGAFLSRRAYEKWAALDRYGMIMVLAFIILFRRPFFDLIGWIINGLARLFL